jgi:spore coat protein CotH
MRRQRSRWVPLIGALLVCAALQGTRAQSEDPLSTSALHEIRLLMNSRDVERLRARYFENTHYAADFLFGDQRVRNVAVRSRGGGSRNASKVGLLVEFDRYVSGQTFAGHQSLVLDNLWQDPSMLRESVTMALFARMGQPSSLESYCRVYINSELQGVYSIVESYDAAFLARAFDDPSAAVHEYHWLRPYYLTDLGDNLDDYAPLFEARTRTTDPEVTSLGPIRDMVQAIGKSFDERWRADVERFVDLPQLLTHVAIETFVSEFDGILGYAGINNFYTYRPTGTTRHLWLPWDRDNAFQEMDASIFRRADENVLVRRALAFPDLYTLYLDVLEQTARAAARDNWLAQQIRSTAALIDAAAAADINTPYSNEQREEAIAYLLTFARQRPQMVLDQVQAARAVPAREP